MCVCACRVPSTQANHTFYFSLLSSLPYSLAFISLSPACNTCQFTGHNFLSFYLSFCHSQFNSHSFQFFFSVSYMHNIYLPVSLSHSFFSRSDFGFSSTLRIFIPPHSTHFSFSPSLILYFLHFDDCPDTNLYACLPCSFIQFTMVLSLFSFIYVFVSVSHYLSKSHHSFSPLFM